MVGRLAGHRVIDITDPQDPYVIGVAPTVGLARSVDVAGHHVFVADRHGGVGVFDIQSANPIAVSTSDISGSGSKMDFCGGRAYLADGAAGLQIFNVSNSARLAKLGRYQGRTSVEDVKVIGDYAIVAAGTGGLEIIDVHSGDDPVRIGGAAAQGNAVDIEVVANRAYLATSYWGLEIFDLREYTNAIPLGSFNIDDGEVVQVRVIGDTAFLADRSLGIRTVGVRDPTAPEPLNTFEMRAVALTVKDGVIYALDSSGSLQIIDAHDPTAMFYLGEVRLDDQGFDVEVDHDWAYVACGTNGICVLDVSNPSKPKLVTRSRNLEQTLSVKLAGTQILITGGGYGVALLDRWWVPRQ
jgi:hypothetical protein